MFVENNPGIVFIHIPKTGGVSIHSRLKEIYGKNNVKMDVHHHTLHELLYKHPKCKEYIKFSIVRNPWDKMVSQFFYAKKKNRSEFRINNKDTLTEWLKRVYDGSDHMTHGNNFAKYFCGNQIMWLLNSDGHVDMDAILRFEKLDEHFKKFCEEYNIKYSKLPHKNASVHKPYQEYYDNETKGLVAKHFEKDIELFDYNF